MKKLFPFLKPYTKECIVSPLFKLLEAGFDLMVPLIVKEIIDVGIATENTSYVWRMVGILCLFALIGLSCTLVAQYFAAKAAVGFATRTRSVLYEHIGKFTYAQSEAFGSSSLITRMTSDINQVQSGINLTLRLLLRSPIIVFGAVLMAFWVDARSALIFLVVVPILAVIVFSIFLIGFPKYRRVQKDLDRVTELTRENLTGVRVLRAFRLEENEISNFESANALHKKDQIGVGNLNALMNPLTLIFVDLGLIALLWSGSVRVDAGLLSTGAIVALTNYMAQILVELIKFANTVFTVNKALACASRIEEVLSSPAGEEKADAILSQDLAKRGEICFSHVSFTYPRAGAPSLFDVTFEIHAGEVAGIIGSTGSGKTTIANLIPRFYDATEGTVTVGGVDVRKQSSEELRKSIAVVPQKAVLFRGTVRSNLLWGNETATEEELWSALKDAQADGFVQEVGGLDAPVLQNGSNFSGGQRQRLTIARALVRKPSILILDDSSSALDYATDFSLRKALSSLPYHPTILLISQRTAALKNANPILVLEDGRVVGNGSENVLLRNCTVYREIYDSQFQKGGDRS